MLSCLASLPDYAITIYYAKTMKRVLCIGNKRKKEAIHITAAELDEICRSADPELQNIISLLEKCPRDEFDSLFIFNKKRKTYTLSLEALQQRRDAARIPRKKNVVSNNFLPDLNERLQRLSDIVKEFERNFHKEIQFFIENQGCKKKEGYE